ncbi:MAG: hypothetical protein JNJ73_09720 [Hyphomonadaceae bacterium]|nr:hypothetical protein [Hyphomonadaceae bacterium]
MNPLTLPEAWTNFRYFLRAMAALTEEPARLAARLFLQAHERCEILAWLKPLERLARLLLLAEAATLDLKPVPPRKAGPRREIKGSRNRLVPEESEEWRVGFQLAVHSKRRRGRVRASRGFAAPVYDSVPIAARIEALVRVALDPARYARRLARRLARRPLTRKQTRPLFRAARLGQGQAFAFEHALPAFLALAEPARIRFESG